MPKFPATVLKTPFPIKKSTEKDKSRRALKLKTTLVALFTVIKVRQDETYFHVYLTPTENSIKSKPPTKRICSLENAQKQAWKMI